MNAFPSNSTTTTAAAAIAAGSWAWKINFYETVFNALPPFLLAFGLTSNACAFLVLLRPRLRAMVVHLPLLALSVADSLVLVTGLLRHWLRKATYFVAMGNLDPQAGSDAACKGLELLLYLGLMYSSWLVTLISVERFVTVCVRPHSRTRAFLTSRSGLCLSMGAGLCCLAAVNLHFFVTRGLYYSDQETRDSPTSGLLANNSGSATCRNAPDHAYFVESVFPKLDLTVTAFVPFLVIAACNLCIVCKLRSVRKSSGLSSSQSAVSGNRTTVMLLLTTFVFIALTSPAKVYVTVIGGTQPQGLNPATSPDAFYSHRVAWSILLVLQFSNHCCNFLLYCASNPQFRSEAAGLFVNCLCCLRRGAENYRSQRALTYLRPDRRSCDEPEDVEDDVGGGGDVSTHQACRGGPSRAAAEAETNGGPSVGGEGDGSGSC